MAVELCPLSHTESAKLLLSVFLHIILRNEKQSFCLHSENNSLLAAIISQTFKIWLAMLIQIITYSLLLSGPFTAMPLHFYSFILLAYLHEWIPPHAENELL